MDDLSELKRLAGLNTQPYSPWNEFEGSNISKTGTEKKQIEREKNIKPGDPEWFELWFSRPKWYDSDLGELPNENCFPEFRGRLK